MNNIKIGSIYKHFKGKDLIEKNIYEIIEINVKGKDLPDNIKYTGENNKDDAVNLIVYSSIFQDNKLFAREQDDLLGELPKDKQIEYGQIHRIEPLNNDELLEIKNKDFIESKLKYLEEKYKNKSKKKLFNHKLSDFFLYLL